MIYCFSPPETAYFKNPFLEGCLLILSYSPSTTVQESLDSKVRRHILREYIWQICEEKYEIIKATVNSLIYQQIMKNPSLVK